MLLSSRDQVRAVLAPDRLIWVRISGHRRKLVAKKGMPCEAPGAQPAWQPALDALQKTMEEDSAPADVTVIASNHFVRYVLVPASPELHSRDEELAFARYSFSQVYGDLARAWDVRLSAEARTAARVASALDRDFVQSLQKTMSLPALRLVSVQPLLMAAFNQWRREIRKQDAWFVLIERGRVCCALIRKGRWEALSSSKVGEDLELELPRILDREQYLAGGDAPASILVHAPEFRNLRFDSLGSRVRQLELPARQGFSPYGDTQFALALNG